jgi:glycosyltransferase involved in cell wall biosynthesis
LINSGVSPRKVHLIRNGIDLRPFVAAGAALSGRRQKNEAVLVGWVGRLSHEKGPDLLLSAVATMQSEFPDARFILVGEGPDRLELERSIGLLGLGGMVELQGQRTDMPSVYASCDLMVSSSRREGLPMAILEGMASGLPWVATSVGDVPTVVRDGQTGVLVPPENVEILANSMARMMRNPEERVRMGLAARHLIEAEFSAERMADEYLRVYSGAIEATL